MLLFVLALIPLSFVANIVYYEYRVTKPTKDLDLISSLIFIKKKND